MRVVVLGLLFSIAGSLDAPAQTSHAFCAAASKPVQEDSRLSEAVRAAFGPVAFTSKADECIYPLQVLRYASADVLLTQGNVPGEACHGCGARLSAYVLRRIGGGLKPVAHFLDFAETGTFGAAGDISPLTIGGDDGLVVEAGGTFQGYSFANLDFYAFRDGHGVHIIASPGIMIRVSNGGAMTDSRQATSVEGSWSIPKPGTALAVDYKIVVRGRMRFQHLVWTLDGSRLVLTQGRIPPEIGKTSGNGG